MYDHLYYKSIRRQCEETGRALARSRQLAASSPSDAPALRPARAIADLTPPPGGGTLERYALATYTDTLFRAYGAERGWPTKLYDWTSAQASEAFEAVVRGSKQLKYAFEHGKI